MNTLGPRSAIIRAVDIVGGQQHRAHEGGAERAHEPMHGHVHADTLRPHIQQKGGCHTNLFVRDRCKSKIE